MVVERPDSRVIGVSLGLDHTLLCLPTVLSRIAIRLGSNLVLLLLVDMMFSLLHLAVGHKSVALLYNNF